MVKSIFEKMKYPSIYIGSKIAYLNLLFDSRRNLVNDHDPYHDEYWGSTFPKTINFICVGTAVSNWRTYLNFSVNRQLGQEIWFVKHRLSAVWQIRRRNSIKMVWTLEESIMILTTKVENKSLIYYSQNFQLFKTA